MNSKKMFPLKWDRLIDVVNNSIEQTKSDLLKNWYRGIFLHAPINLSEVDEWKVDLNFSLFQYRRYKIF